MKRPEIIRDKINRIYDNKYLKMYSMDFDNGVFYLQCSRRNREDLVVLKGEEEYRGMTADAVTIVLVVKTPGEEPRLYLEHEYRYPTGHFLLSPPAGLIDPEDMKENEPLIAAAKREIKEETGIEIKNTDDIYVVSPLFFSSPGITDESNAIVCAVAELSDLSSLTDKYSEATECFDGYSLVTKAEAQRFIRECRDENGLFFSMFTWGVLLYFVSAF